MRDWLKLTLVGWRHDRFVGAARNELRLWDDLWPSFESTVAELGRQDFPDLKEVYRDYRRIAARIMAELYVIETRMRRATLILIFGSFAVPPLITGDLRSYVVMFPVCVGGAVLIELSVLGIQRLLSTNRFYYPLAALIVLASILAGYAAIEAQGLQANAIVLEAGSLSLTQLLAFAPLAAAGAELIALIAVKVTDRVETARRYANLMSSPDVSAVSYLLDVAEDVRSEDGFVNYGDRIRMIRSIETAARLIQNGIPRSIRLLDPTQRIVFEDRCRSAGAWIRTLTLWVALPGPRTHSDLSNVCLSTAVVLVIGQYDQLPQGDLPKTTGRQRLRAVLSILRAVVAGAIPALVLLGVRWLGIPVSGPLGAAATVFCVAWAAVTYLQLIDPLLGQRLSTMREVLGTVRGGFGNSTTPPGK